MDGFVNRIAESKFIKPLEKISDKLSASSTFSTISGGMGATMGLIMIGAVVQIILALGTQLFGLSASSEFYTRLYMVYQMTMGSLGLFMAFNIAYTHARKYKMNGVQAGFISMICFFLVVAPVQKVTANGGTSFFNAISIDALGAGGMFVALLVGIVSVNISRFVIKKNWVIKMPDAVPEGILNSFNSIIPAGINIIFWYGLATVISVITKGAVTLPNLIMYILSIPLGLLLSTPGMILIIFIVQIFWFFGIHGTSVVFAAMMVPFISAYNVNAVNAAQGLPLVYSAVFLITANGLLGGAGNTLPLVIMGLKSKSKTIRTISRASFPTGLFSINEPVIFGYPIMYNPILLIPFVMAPVVSAIFMAIALHFQLMALPQVLIMTTLPVLLGNFMSTLDWRNVVFVILMFPICWAIYFPFYKAYEKQMVAQEQAEAIAEESVQS